MVIVQKLALWKRIALCIAGFIFICGVICFCIVGGFILALLILSLCAWNRLTKKLPTCYVCGARYCHEVFGRIANWRV